MSSDFGRQGDASGRKRVEVLVPGQEVYRPGWLAGLVIDAQGLLSLAGGGRDGWRQCRDAVLVHRIRLGLLHEISDADVLQAGIRTAPPVDGSNGGAELHGFVKPMYRNPVQDHNYPTPRAAYLGWVYVRSPRLRRRKAWAWCVSFAYQAPGSGALLA